MTVQAYLCYLPVIGVHELHGQMHPSYCQITILFRVVDLCSSLAYFMMTQPLPIASKLPIKTVVARQLPTKPNIRKLRPSHSFVSVFKAACTRAI